VKPESNYWFARHSKSIVFLILTLALTGGYLALSIPIAVFPSTNFPRIIIGVDNGVMPINQMLVTITRPLEQAVNSVRGLEDVQSTTSRGSAEIDLFFNWNVDMFRTLQRVNSALARVSGSLPSTVQITTNRLNFSSFPIIGYSLTSKTVSQTHLWEIATYDMKPRLNRLSGVSTVLVQGGEQPEFQITPDPARLASARVTVADLLDAVRRTNLIDSPGLLNRNHQLYLALVSGQVQTAAELGGIVVKNAARGVPVRIEDVASVAPSVAPVYTIVTANGQPAVLLSINRQPRSNTVLVADEVHAEIESLRKLLPAGVELSNYYDQSGIVRDSIKSVRDAIIVGLILASVILVLFLRDWGTSLVAGLVIPVTLLVTFLALRVLGQSFNLMTLGGLAAAVGLVIDDAIVVVENIVLHRAAGESRLVAIHRALEEITTPLIGSTVTPIVVFLPLISITGVTGVFFRALAVTMAVSLLTSLVLALLWTPNLSLYFLRGRFAPEPGPSGDLPTAGAGEDADATEKQRRSADLPLAGAAAGESPSQQVSADPPAPAAADEAAEELRRLLAAEEASMTGFFGHVIRFYERWLRRALRHPFWLAGLSALLIVVAYFSYRNLGSDLLPAMDEGGFVLDYVMPPGSSLAETNRVVSHIEQIIRAVPEVASTSRRTGLQLGLAAVTEANTGDISVRLKSKRSRGIQAIISEVRHKVTTQEPGIDVDFTQVLQDMIGDLTSAPQPVQIRLFSPDGGLLNRWAPRVADAISQVTVGGKHPVVDVADGVENATSGPAVMFQVDPFVASRYGFTPEDVALDASALLDGEPATTPVIENDRAATVRVRFPESTRASLNSLRSTLLVSPSGQSATLGALATVTELPGQTEILRENQQRNVAVTARLEGLDLGSGIAAVQKAVDALKMPPSIRVAYEGAYKEQQRSFRDLLLVLALAIVFVFLVLLFEFGTFSAPAAILSSAVLSTSGVFFALLITGVTFNISSFMGVIMVIGIVAKNGILLLDAFHKFRRLGYSLEEALVQAGRRRLRPIVMTAMAAVAGMLPLALAIGAGSQMLQPLAISVIGGILISMILSLIVTPAMQFYLLRER
jgi:multidrug efflux pump subunit AcrB